jgi:type IV pilus assembly protein PilX
MKPYPMRSSGSRRRQAGVVLFVALIVLIIMTLAGLALLRQMGAGTSIAGNIAFKENATSVADRGTEFARQWIVANSSITANTSLPDGYLSSWAGSVDPTTFFWDTQSLTLPGTVDQTQTGNTARIIIQRLCATANMSAIDPAQQCSDFPVPNGGESHGGGGYPSVLPGTSPKPFYRITTRVDGPRNTVSYTQVLMQ